MFTQESMEQLRERVDLVEVLSPYVELKRAGAAHKALCPFHDEKSPSFVVQRGDRHYHCFGCGAHGDAIEFLMNYQKMSFVDAVEHLAQVFQVHLEREEGEQVKGSNKGKLKEILRGACDLYHQALLKAPEPLKYLQDRGLDLEFVKRFEIGFGAPVDLTKLGPRDLLLEAGLLNRRGNPFFADRLLFPICDAMGSVIGFSGRKIREETFGGKYVNTPETPLFRKSKVLFGLHHCRRRIAKERRAVIVEGQIDALRLIHAGLNVTVAGQGTAFGQGQAQELLNLGVREVLLAMDGDTAGREAAAKVGDLFQSSGVAVKVVRFEDGSDPDTLLNSRGMEAVVHAFRTAQEYLPFLVEHYGGQLDGSSPAGKAQLVRQIREQVDKWEDPVMVHETLRRLAELTELPDQAVGAGVPVTSYQRRAPASKPTLDPNLILETDVLRWLLLMQDSWFLEAAQANLTLDHFRLGPCRNIYEALLGGTSDLLTLAVELGDEEQKLMSRLLERKVNRDRAKAHFKAALQKLLERDWLEARDRIRREMQEGGRSDDELIELARDFDRLKKPEVTCT